MNVHSQNIIFNERISDNRIEKKEKNMLYDRTTKSNMSPFTKETVLRAGMNAELPFLSCGVAPEPQNPWIDSEKRFDRTTVSGYGYWVCQNEKDTAGKVYRQNPILVVVPGDEGSFTNLIFGEKVIFTELGGYFSRKKHIFKFQANGIKKVK